MPHRRGPALPTLLPALLSLALPLAPLGAQQRAAAETSPPPTPDQRFAALQGAYIAASQQWRAAFDRARAAGDEAEQQRLRSARVEQDFLADFVAGAEEYAGTGDAVPFLVWVVTRGYSDPDRTAWAIETMVREHVTSPRLMVVTDIIGFASGHLGRERAHALLTRIHDHNGDPEVAESALFVRAGLYLGAKAQAATPAQREQAVADLRAVLATTKDERLRELATGQLREAESLAVGMPAPEIEGEDLDGVAFKLSDYRGKVVMLTFWGDW